jgi:hypothetical protein
MPHAFTQELRREGFCQEHPLVLEAADDQWSVLLQHKHASYRDGVMVFQLQVDESGER